MSDSKFQRMLDVLEGAYDTSTDTIKTSAGVTQLFKNRTAFARPANTTAYPVNSVYGTIIEVTGLGVANGNLYLTDLNLMLDIAAIPSGMGVFRIYLYSANPASTLTNTQTWAISTNTAILQQPYGIALNTVLLSKDGGRVVSQNNGLQHTCKLSPTGSLFLYIVTDTGFTPAANSETGRIEIAGVSI